MNISDEIIDNPQEGHFKRLHNKFEVHTLVSFGIRLEPTNICIAFVEGIEWMIDCFELWVPFSNFTLDLKAH